MVFGFSSFRGNVYELTDSNMHHEFQSLSVILTEALVLLILGRRNSLSCLLSLTNMNLVVLNHVFAFP